jgi:LytS/YehU family sensor histidine kinase
MLAAFIIRYAGGFLVSLFLRQVYRGCDYRNLTTATLLRLAPSFFLAVHVWFAIDMIKDLLWNDWADFPTYYAHKLLWNSMFLMWWSLFYFGIKLWIDWRRQKEETVKAEILAQNARLQMLPYQLDPQFLFRSLEVIQISIDEREDRAKNLITDLSEFLRYSLLSRRYPVAPLRWELSAMRHYAALVSECRDEESKLTYRTEREADEFPVHAFTLYPVMDWAFGTRASAQVSIEAHVHEGLLQLEISRTSHPDTTSSKDLSSLRQRLEASYPERNRLNFMEQNGRTFIIELHPALGEASWIDHSNP